VPTLPNPHQPGRPGFAALPARHLLVPELSAGL